MGSYTWGMMNVRLDRERIEIANVILGIVDDEKLFVVHDDVTWDVEELRMQLREVAFALIQGKEVKASMLSWEKKRVDTKKPCTTICCGMGFFHTMFVQPLEKLNKNRILDT